MVKGRCSSKWIDEENVMAVQLEVSGHWMVGEDDPVSNKPMVTDKNMDANCSHGFICEEYLNILKSNLNTNSNVIPQLEP